MVPVIRIDNEVMAKLRERAKALDLVFEPPNSTLRAILSLPPTVSHDQAGIQAKPQSDQRVKGPPTVKSRYMPEYVKKARNRYDERLINAEGFITEVWRGIRDSAEKNDKGQHVVERATVALLELLEDGEGLPVEGRMILDKARIAPNQTSTHGTWPWLGARVVSQEKDERGRRCYSIPDHDLYAALRKVVMGATRSPGAEK